jgi:hypothetical protein
MTMIEPDLIFSVLCDDVRREDNGKLILVGLFAEMSVSQFPYRCPLLCVANKWGKGQGEFHQRTRVVTPDDDVLIEDRMQEFELEDLDSSHVVVTFFRNVRFPHPGRYAVEVLLDGELKQRYPIHVVEG